MNEKRRNADPRLDSIEKGLKRIEVALLGNIEDEKKVGIISRLGVAELKIRFILYIFSGCFTGFLLRLAYVQFVPKI